MSNQDDDNDLFGLSAKALGEFVASLGGSAVSLQFTYRKYGDTIITKGLFGAFLVQLLNDKATFMEKLAKVDIIEEFHQELIFRVFELRYLEKTEAKVVGTASAASSSAASVNKASMPCDRSPTNEIKRGHGRPPKRSDGQKEKDNNNNDDDDDDDKSNDREDHVDSSLSSVSSSHYKVDVPKKKRRRLMDKENDKETESKAVGGGASSGMAISSSGTTSHHRGRKPIAVECLDLKTGAVVKRYSKLKGEIIRTRHFVVVLFFPCIFSILMVSFSLSTHIF